MFGANNGLKSKLANAVREGVVSEIFPERHSCRVTFAEKDNLVSAEMPVLTLFSYGNKSYTLPEIGTRVVCLMAQNDGSGGGYVIGSMFTGESLPPAGNEDITRLEFSDEAFLEYDRKSHNFKIQFSDKSYINFDAAYSELEIYCKGNIMINGDKRLEISTKDLIDVESSDNVEITGRNIKLN